MKKTGKMGIAILLLVGMVWLASGCVSMADYKKMENKYRTEMASLNSQREALAKANALKDADNQKISWELGQAKSENTKLKNDIKTEQETRIKLTEEFISGFGRIPNVTIEGGKLEIQGEVLFDPGKAELKEKGKDTLSEIAKKFKENPKHTNYLICIEGHTDSDQINQSKSQWTTGSNFELGAYRALKVLLHLEEEGVDPTQMYLASFGEHHPKDPEDKAKNRRVVIGFVPIQVKSSDKEPAPPEDDEMRK